jgi:hypothetical protein
MISFPDIGRPDHPAADARVIAGSVPNPQSIEIAGYVKLRNAEMARSMVPAWEFAPIFGIRRRPF